MRSPRLRTLLLALALLGPAPAQADEPAITLDLSDARVRASPGWPAALEGFLPPGQTVEPLTRAAAQSSQLILGLWDSDPVAREWGVRALGLDPRHGPRGGYVKELVLHKGYPVGILLAQDAAALAAARFELETFAAGEVALTERRVDVMQPDGEAGVRMTLGRRVVVPQYRLRVLGGLASDEGPLDVAAAHANRLWLDAEAPHLQAPRRSRALLAEHGVVPVAATTVRLEAGADAPWALPGTPTRQALERLLASQRGGIQHFALTVRAHEHTPLDAGLARREQALIEAFASALRPGGLEELLVIPVAASDDAERRMPAPDLRRIPGALLGWKGPVAQPLTISLAAAQRKVRRAGVPVVLVETWMQQVIGLPSLPRGRDPRLGDVLAGIVVLEGPGASDVLARTWSPAEALDPQRDAAALFTSLPAYEDGVDVAEYLAATAAALEAARSGRFSDPHWLRLLPERAREASASPLRADALLIARLTEAAVATDGHLSEPAWLEAPITALGPARVRALAQPQRVVVGVEVPVELRADALLEVTTPTPDGPRTRRFRLARRSCAGAPVPVAFEVPLEHYDLGGDPHPALRCALNLRLLTSQGTFTLAAPLGPPQAPRPGASLVIVR